MAKPEKEKPEKPEILPDAWERFRQAVHVMAKAGPQHRIGGATVKTVPKQPKRMKSGSNGRLRRGEFTKFEI
jgi:hypothetical protein